ncbi:hypothetical protein GCM10010289_01910 [Streptomyces violascens]|uniref:Secreted protein n=1 Tax=Streptomyces violascens TaxID=67381 RepID=A0ABQ3QF08_9ACTN|nr:hypothetical protein GCM10010289_01910 [Streptomyces violascens]GHI35856.1 hypothetical protein Sviol_02640 [Streptomyces violascens]
MERVCSDGVSMGAAAAMVMAPAATSAMLQYLTRGLTVRPSQASTVGWRHQSRPWEDHMTASLPMGPNGCSGPPG